MTEGGQVGPATRAALASLQDQTMFCAVCHGERPHRFRPSPEAGPYWRCSECGEATLPAAGSDAAIFGGCKCPVLDNHHGKGYMGGVKDEHGDTVYVTAQTCPLHGREETEPLKDIAGCDV